VNPTCLQKEQVGQLSQINCTAGWVSFGKNISGRQITQITANYDYRKNRKGELTFETQHSFLVPTMFALSVPENYAVFQK